MAPQIIDRPAASLIIREYFDRPFFLDLSHLSVWGGSYLAVVDSVAGAGGKYLPSPANRRYVVSRSEPDNLLLGKPKPQEGFGTTGQTSCVHHILSNRLAGGMWVVSIYCNSTFIGGFLP